MLLFDLMAERKIAEAIARGELANLPGEGKPLDLDEDRLVPEDVRMACRMLKNAGFVPPELERLREISALERLVESLAGAPAQGSALQKLRLLRIRLDESRPARRNGLCAAGYLDQLVGRLG